MKTWQSLTLGILIGALLLSGVVLLSRPDLGAPITLKPAPTATLTGVPTRTPTLPPITIQLGGAVENPGLYTLPERSRLSDAIELAGGMLTQADETRVNAAQQLSDGDYFYIPAFDEAIPETAANAPNADQADNEPAFDYPLDLNTASLEALETLPGIGPTKAGEIITFRETYGHFLALEDLVNVPGIGPTTLENLRPYLTIVP
jgi:competence protein ComEA